jgi:hypothetical protein
MPAVCAPTGGDTALTSTPIGGGALGSAVGWGREFESLWSHCIIFDLPDSSSRTMALRSTQPPPGMFVGNKARLEREADISTSQNRIGLHGLLHFLSTFLASLPFCLCAEWSIAISLLAQCRSRVSVQMTGRLLKVAWSDCFTASAWAKPWETSVPTEIPIYLLPSASLNRALALSCCQWSSARHAKGLKTAISLCSPLTFYLLI